MELKPTNNRKTKAYDAQKNTFGLLPGKDQWKGEIMGTCPGATTGKGGCWNIEEGHKCVTCYVAGTMSAYSGVYPALKHNTEMAYNEEMYIGLCNEFLRFQTQELKRKKEGKVYSLNYRIHWSGDVFDEEYATALMQAMTQYSDLNFWMYTRSMFAVPLLRYVPNLKLYISLDPQNFNEGMSTYVRCKDTPNLRLCYMSKVPDFAERLEQYTVLFHGQNLVRKMIGSPEISGDRLLVKMSSCPADVGKADTDGCCHRCKMCLGDKEKHIWFKA